METAYDRPGAYAHGLVEHCVIGDDRGRVNLVRGGMRQGVEVLRRMREE